MTWWDRAGLRTIAWGLVAKSETSGILVIWRDHLVPTIDLLDDAIGHAVQAKGCGLWLCSAR